MHHLLKVFLTMAFATAGFVTAVSNQGFQWAYYPVSPPGQIAYEPAYVKTINPTAQGVTDYISIASNQGLYGNSSLDTYNSFVASHRGYILAPETGIYNLTGNSVDDGISVWVGPQAYSGWNKSNANQSLSCCPELGGSGILWGILQISLVAGRYYPFRLVYRQMGGPLSLEYSITAPSGLTILSSSATNSRHSPFAIQYSCDGTTAPAFQPWGQET